MVRVLRDDITRLPDTLRLLPQELYCFRHVTVGEPVLMVYSGTYEIHTDGQIVDSYVCPECGEGRTIDHD